MRAYFFGNMYLSSIQQGIQAAHATHEMFLKYHDNHGDEFDTPSQVLWHWAREHKTMVLLNAGYGDEIRSLISLFSNSRNPFPWAPFYEGKDSLDGALTTVGIVLPEEIYNAAKALREGPKGNPADLLSKAIGGDVSGFDPWNGHRPSKWEEEMAQRLNNYSLAK